MDQDKIKKVQENLDGVNKALGELAKIQNEAFAGTPAAEALKHFEEMERALRLQIESLGMSELAAAQYALTYDAKLNPAQREYLRGL